MKKTYKLVIVESPGKVKSIQSYLGTEYLVKASFGHIKDLPVNEMGIDFNNKFNLTLAPITGQEERIKELENLAKDASEVYLATDDDREGEAISWHLKDLVPSNVPIHRIIFNAITKTALQESIKKPVPLDEHKYNAQKVRRILDRIMGYKISPILGKKIRRGLSAGRVQSSVLRLIIEREDKIENFKADNWYDISIEVTKEGKNFKALYYGENASEKNILEKKEDVENIIKAITSKDVKIVDIKKEQKQTLPTPPFITSKLLTAANKKLKFDSKKTMEVAQKLYEGFKIDGYERQGLITYMRTDSVRTDSEYIDKVRTLIKEDHGEEFLPTNPFLYDQQKKKNKDDNVQDAHEAIRPTNLELSPEVVKNSLPQDEFKLYSLIWYKFVSSQMAPLEYDKTDLTLSSEGHFFKTSSKQTTFEGFQKVYKDIKSKKRSTKGDSESISEDKLPSLSVGEVLKQSKTPELKEKETKPPSRYDESGLIGVMENKGIGRPATYSATLSGLQNRKYVVKQKGKFIPTFLGEVVCRLLIKNFVEEMKINYTAKMEKDLDKIAKGEIDYQKMLSSFWSTFEGTLNNAKTTMYDIKPRFIPTGIKCESCDKGEYLVRWGKNGPFLACDQYNKEKEDSCKSTSNMILDTESNQIKKLDGYNKVETKVIKFHKDPCPKCGDKVGLKIGKFGKFYSCMNYPKCEFTMPFTLDISCPKCDSGYLAEKNYQGNTFYGCSTYPDCKFTINKKPVNIPCPHCKFKFLVIEEKQKEQVILSCTECGKKSKVKKNK